MLRSFKRLLYFGYNSPQKTNSNLNRIRNIEWDAIKQYIPFGSSFLDLGCGSGYSMKKAITECGCIVTGIDPFPLKAGVKSGQADNLEDRIIEGVGENLPFPDNSFDVVFSSHALEHVADPVKVLQETDRVLKSGGILILGVPTSTSAWINLFSSLIFTTHIRFARFIAGFFTSVRKTRFIHVFLPYSHSQPERTVLSDIRKYRVEKWKKLIGMHFLISDTLFPAFYQFAEFRSPFQIKKQSRFSSSVFFICTKMGDSSIHPLHNAGKPIESGK